MKRMISTLVLVAMLAGGVSAGMIMLWTGGLPVLANLGVPSDVRAQISHQGVVSVSGVRFTGTGYFKLALVDPGPPEAIVWTNDGNNPPSTEVPATITDGVYSITLGGAGMTAISPGLFVDGDLKLRVWFNNGTGSMQLSPDVSLTSVPYAFTVADGAVGTSKLADGAVTSAKAGADLAVIPQGGIILWSGNASNIPAGWALCNGANGTPDLRDRFVIGAGNTYAVGATGGATTHTHDTAIGTPTAASAGAHTHTTATGSTGTGTSGAEAAHTHSVNVASTTTSSDAHTHTGGTLDFARAVTPGGTGNDACGSYFITITSGSSTQSMNVCWVSGTTSSDSHSHTVDPAAVTSAAGSSHSHSVPALSIPALATDSQGAHTHAVSIGTITSTSSSSMSPYYALCYIMKL